MFGRYKEVWCGVITGTSVWAIDAILHVSGHNQFGFVTLIKELVVSDPPKILIRVLFLTVSVALGYSLWQSRERERRARALQMMINSLHRQIVNPLLLIAGYSSSLALKEGWLASRETVEIVSEIQINARKVNELIKQWPVSSAPLPAQAEERVFQQSVGG